jgi:uncharacterized Zn-finger protein
MSERHESSPKRPDGHKGINTQRLIEVTENDLPLHCPMPQHVDWNAHPRVYLPIESSGSALCPYCGTLYRLKGKPSGGSH